MISGQDFQATLPIILASASPRRAELLRQIGVPFEVVVSDAVEPESGVRSGGFGELAESTALRKMQAVAAQREGRVVLAADTLVVIEGRALGKPSSAAEAIEMLTTLSGRTHEVVTGVAVGYSHHGVCRWNVRHASTRVTFADLNGATVRAYVATGEPMDKAGAYGIQGKGACLVERVEGCYFNVVGLPVRLVVEMLGEWGLTAAKIWSPSGLAS